MSYFRSISVVLVCVIGGAFTPKINATPWTSTEDSRLRIALQRVTDAGLIDLPITNWPIAWADIKYGLDHLSWDQVDPAQENSVQTSLQYIRKQLARTYEIEPGGSRNSINYGLSAANTSSLFNAYGHAVEQGAIAEIGSEWQNEVFSAGLMVQYATDPIDQKNWRFDGSYVAATLGNWIFSVGANERWWGPGWQSSLILSNNARPVPAVSFNRAVSYAPESKWLSWIGPWHLTSFIGQLEGDRAVPQAKLWSMRLSFKPFSSNLEIGLSRSAQWGGEGRPESFSEFFKVLTTKGENTANEAGNQLGGFDLRYAWATSHALAAVYGQLIGEDEAGYLPSRKIFMGGLELSGIAIKQSYLNFFLEYSDTLSGRIVEDDLPNYAYEHHTYKSGYRYRSRSMGSSFDNDSRSVTLGGSLIDSEGAVWRAAISQLDLNTDDIAAGNKVSMQRQKLHHFMASHQRSIMAAQLDIGFEWSSTIPDTTLTGSDKFGIYMSIDYRI
ncbi:MAG: capsule assembly Wzi family protein [Pseudomonadales bacterium]|nr:capsule assembly Wzi family protein [Pseudomonadales bacterium]